MFAIFTLRRQNILPVGDLGVQRGMVRWFGGGGFKLRPDKLLGEDDGVQEGIKLVDNPEPANRDDPEMMGTANATLTSDAVCEDPSPKGAQDGYMVVSLSNNEKADALPAFINRTEVISLLTFFPFCHHIGCRAHLI